MRKALGYGILLAMALSLCAAMVLSIGWAAAASIVSAAVLFVSLLHLAAWLIEGE